MENLVKVFVPRTAVHVLCFCFSKLLFDSISVNSIQEQFDRAVSSVDEAIIGAEVLRQLIERDQRLPSFAILYKGDQVRMQ